MEGARDLLPRDHPRVHPGESKSNGSSGGEAYHHAESTATYSGHSAHSAASVGPGVVGSLEESVVGR